MTISRVSNRKALTRSPAGPTTKGSDSPSGVSTGWMRALSSRAALMTASPAPAAPRRGNTRSRRRASGWRGPSGCDVVHHLAEDSLDQPREKEHGDGAQGEQRDLPPLEREVAHPRVPAGEDERRADRHAGRAAQADRAQLGDA